MEILMILLPMLLPLLADCGNSGGKKALAKKMRKRPGMVAWPTYKAARADGCSRKEARRCSAEAVEELRNASDEEIKELIAEAMDDES